MSSVDIIPLFCLIGKTAILSFLRSRLQSMAISNKILGAELAKNFKYRWAKQLPSAHYELVKSTKMTKYMLKTMR